MARRRTTVKREIEPKQNIEITWDEATDLFLDHLKIKGLAQHTMLWHRGSQ